MMEAIGTNGTRRTASRDIFDKTIIVSMPYFERRFVEQDRELGVHPAQQCGEKGQIMLIRLWIPFGQCIYWDYRV